MTPYQSRPRDAKLKSMPNVAGGVLLWVVLLLFVVLLFIAMREVWCWYWKLNDLGGELRLIRGLLERAEARAAAAPGREPTTF